MVSKIQNLLRDFAFPYPEGEHEGNIEEALEQIRNTCFTVLEEIGYSSENIFQNVTLPVSALEEQHPHLDDEFWADYVIGESPASSPYLVASVILADNGNVNPRSNTVNLRNEILRKHRYYSKAINCVYFIAFSNEFLTITNPIGKHTIYSFEQIGSDDVENIKELLSPPRTFPDGSFRPTGFHPNQVKLREYENPPLPADLRSEPKIEKKLFELDLTDYDDALWRRMNANSSREKGDSLEALANLLLKSICCLTVKDTNVVTRSREIDLIAEYVGSDEQTLFDYYGRYILIECKNWDSPVPVKEIGEFESKLRSSDVDLGILFAWNGVTGAGNREYGEAVIESSPENGPTILVFDERDLYRIARGESFYELIDSKLYRQRFNVRNA